MERSFLLGGFRVAESSLQRKKRASKEFPVFPLDIRFACPIPWQFFVSSFSVGVGGSVS